MELNDGGGAVAIAGWVGLLLTLTADGGESGTGADSAASGTFSSIDFAVVGFAEVGVGFVFTDDFGTGCVLVAVGIGSGGADREISISLISFTRLASIPELWVLAWVRFLKLSLMAAMSSEL